MLTQEVSLLVVGLFAVVSGIRVDWNTNQGPIVPPTPRTTVRPVMPYREPAPVWEDQSNDIPNPNPYVYVAPPPSRPRYNDNDNNNYNNNNINYGVLVAPGAASSNNGLNTHYRASVSTVAGLAPKYVPGVGIQYYGIVPAHKALPSVNNSKANESNRGYYGDKIQGKYNAKTKKYKAYEKVKAYGELNQQQQQQPSNNYNNNNNNNNQQDDKGQLTATATAQSAPPITSPSVLQLALEEQQLPEVQTARQFHTENTTLKTSLPLPSSSSKSSSSSSKSSWSHKKGHGGDKYWHKSTYYTHLLNSIQS